MYGGQIQVTASTAGRKDRWTGARFWGLFLVNFLILALRRRGPFTRPQFWAEDSIVFYRDQLVLGSWHALWKPHSGYLTLVARLIALCAAVLPAALAPLAFNCAALALAALSCTVFFLPWYRDWIESNLLRAMLCVLFAAGFFVDELIGNVTNVLWYLALLGILLLARSPQDDETTSIPKLLGLAFAAFLAGLSSPVLMILIPICVGLLARGWRRRSALVPGGLLLALTIQAVVMRTSSVGGGGILPIEHTLLGALTVCLLYRSILPAVAGETRSQYMASNFHDASVVIFLIAMVLWMVWLWKAERGHRLRLTMALYVGIASVAIAIVVRGKSGAFGSIAGVKTWGAERYYYLASCIFAYLVARSLSLKWPNRSKVALAFSLIFICGVAANFHAPQLVDYWSQDAPLVDVWRRGLREGRAEGIEVPVNPAGWELELPGTLPADAGFEGANLGPWAVFGLATADVSSAQHYEGKHSIELGNTGGVFQDIVGLRAGAWYRVSAQGRSECGLPSMGSIWLHDTFGGNMAYAGPRQAPCDRWDKFSADFHAGARGMLRIHLVGSTAKGKLFWDDVRLTECPNGRETCGH